MKTQQKITCFRYIPLKAFYLHGHTAFNSKSSFAFNFLEIGSSLTLMLFIDQTVPSGPSVAISFAKKLCTTSIVNLLFQPITGACYGYFKSIHQEHLLWHNDPEKHSDAAAKKKLRSRRQRVILKFFLESEFLCSSFSFHQQ